MRVAMLTAFALVVCGQCLVSIMAISRNEYYNNVTFGYCSMCFDMVNSKYAYESEFISVKNTAGDPVTPSYGMGQEHPTFTSFVEFCHQGLTSNNCQLINVAVVIVAFAGWFLIELHFVLVMKQILNRWTTKSELSEADEMELRQKNQKEIEEELKTTMK